MASCVGLVVAVPVGADAQEVEWTRQFGTPDFDLAASVSAHGGAVYVVGQTAGALPGQSNLGGADAFIRKYESAGAEQWTRQFGTEFGDSARAVAVSEGPLSAGIYVAGRTFGALPGHSNAGGRDVFVRKLGGEGDEVWTTQFGTSASESALDVAVDETGIYLLISTGGEFPGETSAGGTDLVAARLNLDGTLAWARQFGTPYDDPVNFLVLGGVALDETGVYVASTQGGEAFHEAPVVRKFDRDGNPTWTRDLSGPCSPTVIDVETHDGGVFVAGDTLADPDTADCSLPQPFAPPEEIGYVQRYDPDGNKVWTSRFTHRAGWVIVQGELAVDGSGVYVESEAFRGDDEPEPGRNDPACPRRDWREDPDIDVRAFGLDGAARWRTLISTPQADIPSGLSVDATGVYVVGFTECALPGQTNTGGEEMILSKIGKAP